MAVLHGRGVVVVRGADAGTVTILALGLLVLNGAPRLEGGRATYYRPGLMAEVASNRGMSLAGYAGGVALNDCRQLGAEVWLQWGPGQVTGPHLSVDCARDTDLARRQRQGRVVEVDAALARAIGFYGIGPRRVVVWFEPPPQRWRAN